MSEKDRFADRAKMLSQRDLAELKKEIKPRVRTSFYRDYLSKFMESSSPGLQIEHVTVGEQAGFLGMVYPAKKGGKAPFSGKIMIQTRREEGIEKDKTGNPVKDKKGKPRPLYTIILTKLKKG